MASKVVKDILQISRIKVMTSMTSVSVSDTLRTYTNDDLPVLSKMKMVGGLLEAYTYVTNSSTIKSESFTRRSEVEFAVGDHIEIFTCSEYTVISHV